MLQNKNALITGGSQGVGLGIALALAKEGANVAITGRSEGKLNKALAELKQHNSAAIAIVNDVKDKQSLEHTVATTVEAFAGIDILVNNAQEVPLGTLLDISDEKFVAGFESGPQATLRLMQLCYPYLKQGGGSIVNLASSAGKRWDAAGYGAYAAVKEGIRALTRAAACEWGQDGIRANVILPHATSPGLKWWIENCPEEAEAFIDSIPMKRIGDCEEDVGRFVATLCSDNCAYVNGQSIALDGGQAYLG
jgi:NAD(P)-dependent dehydrogenase (short-subunit alcohol dehydrogenase family)